MSFVSCTVTSNTIAGIGANKLLCGTLELSMLPGGSYHAEPHAYAWIEHEEHVVMLVIVDLKNYNIIHISNFFKNTGDCYTSSQSSFMIS